MGYFPTGASFRKEAHHPVVSKLVTVVRPLNAASKQAMYAAAKTKTIARRTWDGCAWNAAGKFSPDGAKSISSTEYAGEVFGVSSAHVARFIETWDAIPESYSDQQVTRFLLQALETVGTHTEPNMSRTTRIVKGYAFKSLGTQFAEQLESGELTVDMIPGAREMEAVLCGASI